MLKVIFEDKDNKLTLKLDGHAGQASIGHDIVCASCSILAYTVAQLVKVAEAQGDLLNAPEIKLENGDAIISCEPIDEARSGLYAAYMFVATGYNLLAHNYPQYVDLKSFGKAE